MTARAAESLAGVAVLVTRPSGQAAALCRRLADAGAEVHAVPLLAVEPLPDTAALREAAQHLDRYEIVLATSRHAVEVALPAFADYWPQWPVAQHWFAVGPATATALASHGLQVLAPEDARSEGLLAMAELQDVSGRRVLLLAGEGGRDALETGLAARGAVITRLSLYRRVPVPSSRTGLEAFRDIPAARARRVALVTSGEALQNLLALAPWLPDSDITLLVASARIADLACAAGVSRLRVCAGAGDEQQLAALREFAAAQPDEDPA